MSLFKRLFGGGGTPEAPEPTDHKGFRIYPEPIPEGGRHRIAAKIEKDVDGTTQTHHLIRADVVDTRAEAETLSLAKAKQMIDEQGEGIFRDG